MPDKLAQLKRYLQDSVPEWQDDLILRSLFAPLPQNRSIHPESFDRKLNFWESILKHVLLAGLLDDNSNNNNNSHEGSSKGYVGGSRFSVSSGGRVKEKFQKDGKLPLCWEAVFLHWHRTGKVLKLDEFKQKYNGNAASSSGTGASVTSYLVDWIKWGVGQGLSTITSFTSTPADAGRSGIGASNLEETFVFVDLVKDAANMLLNQSRNPPSDGRGSSIGNSIFEQCCTVDEMIKEWIPHNLKESGYTEIKNEEDSRLLFNYMLHSKDITVLSKGIVLKPGCSKPTVPIETITNALKIKSTISLLQTQVSDISLKIESCKKQIKEMLSRDLKSRALLSLRQCKNYESVLSQRCKALENLELVYMKIESSATDAQVLESYELGAKTIETLLKDYGITPERVHETMDHLDEVLANQREIEGALSQPTLQSESADFDEDELSAELDKLIESERKVEEPATIPIAKPETLANVPLSTADDKNEDDLVKQLELLSVEPAIIKDEEETKEEEDTGKVLIPG